MLRVRTRAALAASAAVAVLAATASAAVATTPRDLVIEDAPSKVTMDLQTMNGSGCKAGTATAEMSKNNQVIDISYSEFTASVGAGIPGGDFRKNCQLGINVHVPQGYTYAISNIRHLGYVDVANEGQKARLTTNYYFAGDNLNADLYTDWYPDYTDSFDITHSRSSTDLVWSPCGKDRLLNINTTVRVDNGKDKSAFAMIALDSSKVQSKTMLNLSWKKC